jgi:hypothetical protein
MSFFSEIMCGWLGKSCPVEAENHVFDCAGNRFEILEESMTTASNVAAAAMEAINQNASYIFDYLKEEASLQNCTYYIENNFSTGKVRIEMILFFIAWGVLIPVSIASCCWMYGKYRNAVVNEKPIINENYRRI